MSDVIKYRSVTYNGARALVREIRTAGPHGLRTYLTYWQDKAVGQPIEWAAGTTTSRTVTGNPRGKTFQTLVPEHPVPDGSFFA